MHASVRQRLLLGFVRRGLLAAEDARAMGAWDHGGGFSRPTAMAVAASWPTAPSVAQARKRSPVEGRAGAKNVTTSNPRAAKGSP